MLQQPTSIEMQLRTCICALNLVYVSVVPHLLTMAVRCTRCCCPLVLQCALQRAFACKCCVSILTCCLRCRCLLLLHSTLQLFDLGLCARTLASFSTQLFKCIIELRAQ